MAITLKDAGTYTNLVNSQTVVIGGSPASGDRMFLFATAKDYATTIGSPSGWTPIGSEYSDGTTSSGNGTGSMRIQAWYRDWQPGDSNPVLSALSGADGGAAIIQVWSKASGETWTTPKATNAAWPANTANSEQTVSAVGALTIGSNNVVIAFLGLSDDVATLTRPSAGIDATGSVTWNGNYVESPSTHFQSTSALDSSADLGHRFVSGGESTTLKLSATLPTSETGAVKFVVQGLDASNVSQELTFTSSFLDWKIGTVILSSENSLTFISPFLDWKIGTNFLTTNQATNGSGTAARARWVVSPGVNFLRSDSLTFTTPKLTWGVGANLTQALAGFSSPSLTWEVGTFQTDTTISGIGPGMEWRVGISYLAMNQTATFTPPELQWGVGASVMHLLSYIGGTIPALEWRVGTFTPVYDQPMTFTAPSLRWRAQAYINHDTLLTWTQPSASWMVGSSSLDAEMPFTAPGMNWSVGTFTFEGTGQIVFDSPALEWEVGSSSLTAIAETTWTAPGMIWETAATLSAENSLTGDSPGLRWEAGDSGLNADTSLSGASPAIVWHIPDVSLTAISETTWTAPGLRWTVGGNSLDFSIELTFSAPQAQWTVGTSTLDALGSLAVDAPGLPWVVGSNSFSTVSEITFTAPGMLWEASAGIQGENSLSFTSPALQWLLGDSQLVSEGVLSFTPPAMSWEVPDFEYGTTSVLTVTSPSLRWVVTSVLLIGGQIGGPYGGRRHHLLGTSEARPVLVGSLQSSNARI